MKISESKASNYLHSARLLLGKPIDWGFAVFMATLFGALYYWYQYPIPLEPIPAFVNLEKSTGTAKIISSSRGNNLYVDEHIYLCFYDSSSGASGTCMSGLKDQPPLQMDVYWYLHRTSGGKRRLMIHATEANGGKVYLSYEKQKEQLLRSQLRNPLISPALLFLQSILIFFVTFSVTLFISRAK